MPRTPCLLFQSYTKALWGQPGSTITQHAIVHIENATFYRQYPSTLEGNDPGNPPIFPHLTFSLPSSSSVQQHWAVIGPSNAGKTTFLGILRGQHVSLPPTARTYPYLSSSNATLRKPGARSISAAIQYVGFNDQGRGMDPAGSRGAYMSARYESRREETDFSVLDYLTGNTELNPYGGQGADGSGSQELAQVIRDLNLANLVEMPVGNLSNGQTRRARIAKALLGKPEVLLLDEPFMGLDPPTQAALSPLLFDLARASSPRLLLALRPQDPVPGWITHLIYLNPSLHVEYQGTKEEILGKLGVSAVGSLSAKIFPNTTRSVSDLAKGTTVYPEPLNGASEPIVQMKNVIIKYGDKKVMGGWKQDINGEIRAGLDWTVRKGERWGVFGPNGSGKTTLISLICSDHPQAYSLPIQMFGRGRLPQPGQPGISIFDIQARIGQSSPEIHAFFPRNLTIRKTIENAWADTFLGTAKLTPHHHKIIKGVLRWFEPELNPVYDISKGEKMAVAAQPWSNTDWADNFCFRDLSFSSQRVALFLRAIVKRPELIVLDEAFGGMDEPVRDKCMFFLTWGTSRSYYHDQRGDSQQYSIGEADDLSLIQIRGLDGNQALICVSHLKEEVPDVVRSWMCLPEAGEGKPARFGRLHAPLKNDEAQWRQIWDM